MSKTGRDVDLIFFLRGEADAGVRRADPGVNGDVQRFAFDNATELGLRVRQLIVKAAKSSPGRNGVVVLKEVYIPAGFAHGFLALTETVQFLYKCSDYYA